MVFLLKARDFKCRRGLRTIVVLFVGLVYLPRSSMSYPVTLPQVLAAC